jgi:hypothetical protein
VNLNQKLTNLINYQCLTQNNQRTAPIQSFQKNSTLKHNPKSVFFQYIFFEFISIYEPPLPRKIINLPRYLCKINIKDQAGLDNVRPNYSKKRNG